MKTLYKVETLDTVTNTSSQTTYDYFNGHYFYDYGDVYKKQYAGFGKVVETDDQ
jgi:hypothetical protein